ncbi:glutamate racemase [Rheinheimera sp. A13L]|uniref:glutamate racemase n=1 Tax=Rheinheimera sp. A13L TaxID=506534 RepID=UPI00021256F3|nr:glutamate racemase [Rheinheimera sp. A13L]EGM76691.1 glutamate racemase [Rheinheimera sp. A13L]
MRIGFIDSGVGGLSIVEAVRAVVPADYFYLMDNRYLPYGTKSELFIRQRLKQLTEHLLTHQVDLIVIACNTATTQAVDWLRQQFDLPFVGVVPAIKPAALYCAGEKMALLATPATVKGHYIQKLVTDYAGESQVQLVGSSELVMLAEKKVWANADVKAEVATVIKNSGLTEFAPKAIILGCTHFPFLAEEIRSAFTEAPKLFDTADAIARRVQHLVAGLTSIYKEKSQDCFIATQELTEQQKRRVTQMRFGQQNCWPDLYQD